MKLRMPVPIQKYVKDLEIAYKTSNSKDNSPEELEKMWDDEFEKLKKNLVAQQKFRGI